MPILIVLLLALLTPGTLFAQRADSTIRLPDIPVTVTRTPTPLGALGAAVTLLDSAALHRNRMAPTLDDALAFVPGVVVSNRWNYSLDQRLAIRGFGARANFGMRGVKVLIDGVPQTLPDGQSQLNHLDLAQVDHVEVLRGAASAEYGNAGGGVLSFSTAEAGATPSYSAGYEAGTFGTERAQLSGSARSGPLSGTLALSRFRTDGSRQHAAAEQRRFVGSAGFALDPLSSLTLRVSLADDPRADNPGALTAAEAAINPDSAAASNIRRVAGKAVTQSQVALSYRRQGERLSVDAVAWRLARRLDNPLAAPPPSPAGATEGTWVGIDRLAGGARAALSYRLGRFTTTAGADLQTMRDDRLNERSLAGIPNGERLVDQQERVTEIGPFIHAEWQLHHAVSLGVGGRWDALSFTVDDRLQAGGSDGSGTRTMGAASGSARLSWTVDPRITIWGSLATAFETPTTTELANQPSGETGLNHALEPQRSVTSEVGMRGRHAGISWEMAGWLTATRRAIVPAQDVGGRSYYQNAGRTRSSGVEATLSWSPAPRLLLLGTATVTRAVFDEYFSVVDDAALDGNALAGLPETVARLGLRGDLGRGIAVDLDQSLRGAMFADDRNTVTVDGLRAGVTGLRLSWHGRLFATDVTTFVSALNLFDRRYIGSVTINGAAGRMLEPAAGRTLSLGLQLGR